MKKIWLVVLGLICISVSINAQDVFEAVATINSVDKIIKMVEVEENYFISLQDLMDALPNNILIKDGNLVINIEQSTKSTNTIVPPAVTSSIVESRIDGEFTGWTGDTLFKLMNGQIWKQAEYNYKYSYKYSPKVTIVNTSSGWIMTVEGVDKSIKVIKIK